MPWDFYLEVFRVFFQSSLITFAGQAALPVLNQEFVHIRGWVTEADVAKSLAVGRLSPGPTGMFVVSLGYLVAGWPGAEMRRMRPRASKSSTGCSSMPFGAAPCSFEIPAKKPTPLTCEDLRRAVARDAR